jgi:hypothetical protein
MANNFDLKKYLIENRMTSLSKHSKQHPDTITYRGAKYQRIGSYSNPINEIQVAIKRYIVFSAVYGGEYEPPTYGRSTSIEKSKPIAANSLRGALETWFNETGQGPALDGKGYYGHDPAAPAPKDFDDYIRQYNPMYHEGEYAGVPAAFLLDAENSEYPFYVVFQNPPQGLVNSMNMDGMYDVSNSVYTDDGHINPHHNQN